MPSTPARAARFVALAAALATATAATAAAHRGRSRAPAAPFLVRPFDPAAATALYEADELVLHVFTSGRASRRASGEYVADAVPPPGWKVIAGGADAAHTGTSASGTSSSSSGPSASSSSSLYLTQSAPVLRGETPVAWRAAAAPLPGNNSSSSSVDKATVVRASAVALYDPEDRWSVRVFKGDAVAAVPAGSHYTVVGIGGGVAGGAGTFLRAIEVTESAAGFGARVRARSACGSSPPSSNDGGDGGTGADSGLGRVTAFAIALQRLRYDVFVQTDDEESVHASAAGPGPGAVAAAAVEAAPGYDVTAVAAAVSGGAACDGFLQRATPSDDGTEALAAGGFAGAGAGDGVLTVRPVVVEAPAMT